MKTIHFISGLPRAGSTLLCALLAQNPRFHVTGTSGLCDVLLAVRNGWDQLPEHKAMKEQESEDAKVRCLWGILTNYHRSQDRVVFDKSRSWLAHLEMIEMLEDSDFKVLVCVRDIRDILASFEMLWRRVGASRQIPYEARDYHKWQTAPGRCAALMASDGVVGLAWGRIQDALLRGYGDRMHFVPFEDLTNEPESTLEGIYRFLGERWFTHHYDNLQPSAYEDDRAYGMPGLHDLHDAVLRRPSRWREVLGNVAAPYEVLNHFVGVEPCESTESLSPA